MVLDHRSKGEESDILRAGVSSCIFPRGPASPDASIFLRLNRCCLDQHLTTLLQVKPACATTIQYLRMQALRIEQRDPPRRPRTICLAHTQT
jgi:hypothetical protein